MQGRNKGTVVGVVLLICLFALVGVVTQMSNIVDKPTIPPPPPPNGMEPYWKAMLAVSPAGPRGVAKAPFSLVEFGDFQCSHCGDARPSIEQAVDGSQGRLNLYYVQTPLTIHKWAEPAAEAALFASKHGKFWQMYDILYTHQKNLEPGNYSSYAAQVGLDGDALYRAVHQHQFASAVGRSNDLADSIGVTSTPLVALHNNRTGQFLWAVQGETDVEKALKKTDWAVPAQTTASTQSSKT